MDNRSEPKPEHRVFIVGLDGATFALLDPWLAQGKLPHLQRLIEAGSANVLRSTFPAVTPVAWSSFMTGRRPDSHGVLGFQAYDPASRVLRVVNGRDVQGASLWRIAGAGGKRVCIVNVPMTWPPEEVNGFLVAGMDTPSLDNAFTHPGELRDELLARFPDYDFVVMLQNEGALVKSKAGLERYLAQTRRLFQVRAESARWLLDRHDWDLFMVQFQSTDRLQHLFWPRMFDGGAGAEQISAVYAYLDRLVGHLLDEVTRRGFTVLIISDHGFGPCYGSVASNTLLRHWGYLALETKPAARVRTWWTGFLGSPPVGGWLHAFRKRVRFYRRWGLRDQLEGGMRRQRLPLDWTRTQAVVRHGDLCGYLYLNSDRYRADGVVAGKRYESLREELRQRLLAETDEEGRPIFRQVLNGEQVFARQYAAKLGPDLVLVPQEGFIISCRVPDRPITYFDAGTHRRDGVLLAAGPGIKAGVELEAEIVDVAPTILALLGLPVPVEMDGRVLAEMLDGVAYESGSVARVVPGESSQDVAYTDAEQEVVEERLRNLGYLG